MPCTFVMIKVHRYRNKEYFIKIEKKELTHLSFLKLISMTISLSILGGFVCLWVHLCVCGDCKNANFRPLVCVCVRCVVLWGSVEGGCVPLPTHPRGYCKPTSLDYVHELDIIGMELHLNRQGDWWGETLEPILFESFAGSVFVMKQFFLSFCAQKRIERTI